MQHEKPEVSCVEVIYEHLLTRRPICLDRNAAAVIRLALSKAFGTGPHEKLLGKVGKMGVIEEWSSGGSSPYVGEGQSQSKGGYWSAAESRSCIKIFINLLGSNRSSVPGKSAGNTELGGFLGPGQNQGPMQNELDGQCRMS